MRSAYKIELTDIIYYYAAICGPPSPPLNGHIYSYSNKSLRVIVVCHGDGNSVNSEERLYISDCHLNGTWQPNPSDFCGRHGFDNASQSSPGKSVVYSIIV